MVFIYIIIVIYSLALVLIFMYALAQLNLLFNYISAQKKVDDSSENTDKGGRKVRSKVIYLHC